MKLQDIDSKTGTIEKTNEKQRVLEWVRRYGGVAADAILDPKTKIFTIPSVDGMIGYRIMTSCAVVYGEPICSEMDLPILVDAFNLFCKERDWNIIYITVSEEFAKWALENGSGACIEFGEELVIDPHNDPQAMPGEHGRLVRRKVKQALKEGLEVIEYTGSDLEIERGIERVGQEWLEARQGPQIHISQVTLFDARYGKRWFYAKQGSKIVGVVVLSSIESKQGWLMNHLMHPPTAPKGTPELLLTEALKHLAQEGCHYVTFGVSTSPQLGQVIGLTPTATWMARKMFNGAHKIFNLDGTLIFWGKFNPESRPSYLVFSKSRIGPKQILALMNALNVSFSNSERVRKKKTKVKEAAFKTVKKRKKKAIKTLELEMD